MPLVRVANTTGCERVLLAGKSPGLPHGPGGLAYNKSQRGAFMETLLSPDGAKAGSKVVQKAQGWGLRDGWGLGMFGFQISRGEIPLSPWSFWPLYRCIFPKCFEGRTSTPWGTSPTAQHASQALLTSLNWTSPSSPSSATQQ